MRNDAAAVVLRMNDDQKGFVSLSFRSMSNEYIFRYSNKKKN